MLRNYLLLSLRNIRKNRWYAAINIFGLSISIVFSLLILLFLHDEFSFDQFHTYKDDLYRVDHATYRNDSLTGRGSRTFWPLAATLREEIPTIGRATRYISTELYVRYEHQSFNEEVFFVDADFPNIFTLEFTEGTAETVLDEPNEMLISAAVAQKYFGDEEAVGKVVLLEDQPLTVSGVFKDWPGNSSLRGQIFTRIEQHPDAERRADNWQARGVYTFVQLAPRTAPERLQIPLASFARSHLRYDEREHFADGLYLTPLTDIHFDHSVEWHNVSNVLYSYLLGGLALLIIGIACINYVLLALANTTTRSKEVGIRKVMGATRSQIRWQFWGESQLIIVVAFLMALLLTQWALPAFNDFTGKALRLTVITDWKLILSISGLLLFTGMLAGGYPALVLSGVLPQKILKSSAGQKYKTAFGNYLITFQFAACLSLMIGVLVMFAQMRFIQTKDLGFDQEQIVMINTTNSAGIKSETILERYRSLLSTEKDIAQISAMFGDFGGYKMSVGPPSDSVRLNFTLVDYNFFQTLDAKLVAGSLFSNTSTNEPMVYVINEAMAKRMEQKPVIGAPLDISPDGRIIGIVKDFHFESLETQIMPMVFIKGSDSFDKLLVKVNPDNIPQTLDKLRATWQAAVGDGTFFYTFLDDQLTAQYGQYQRWMKIILSVSVFGIAIACLGLLGLTGMIALSRTREIGIRKVLGASVSGILLLLSENYFKLIVIAFAIAAPLANYFVTEWLQNFAYKVDISWWMFAFPGALVLLIALLAVGSQTLKAARRNPVDSLRDE